MDIAGNAPLIPLDQPTIKKGAYCELNIYRHRLGGSKT
jgi:hypothetical protein